MEKNKYKIKIKEKKKKFILYRIKKNIKYIKKKEEKPGICNKLNTENQE
tara:strand:+ start:539 stop:685 length:147 start_codon:yes stop_codon:yes gene_type:complete